MKKKKKKKMATPPSFPSRAPPEPPQCLRIPKTTMILSDETSLTVYSLNR